MATTITKNGTATKKETATVKKEVQKKLAKQATAKVPVTPIKEIPVIPIQKPVVNLDARIQQFEKLRGIANKRERLVQTLAELTRFNFNTDDASFILQDSSGMSFKTGNTNLIKLVTSQLQKTLENRKDELESQIVGFEL